LEAVPQPELTGSVGYTACAICFDPVRHEPEYVSISRPPIDLTNPRAVADRCFHRCSQRRLQGGLIASLHKIGIAEIGPLTGGGDACGHGWQVDGECGSLSQAALYRDVAAVLHYDGMHGG
jgi:hypothetical protein